jgi:hypothetical protein
MVQGVMLPHRYRRKSVKTVEKEVGIWGCMTQLNLGAQAAGKQLKLNPKAAHVIW